MKWNLSTLNKIRAIGALLVVFLLVLATNMMDNHHFRVVKRSLKTVYEDRLVAKDYLYKISRQLDIKKALLQEKNKEQIALVNTSTNDSINILITKFQRAKLTQSESRHLKSFLNDLERLYQLEKKLPLNIENSEKIISPEKNGTLEALRSHYTNIFKDLDALSAIQLEEGKRVIALSNRAVETSDLISRFEIGALILIGIIIQFIILYKPLK